MTAPRLGIAVLCALLGIASTGCSDLYAVGWGANNSGQLGTGTFVGSTVPAPVAGIDGAAAVVDVAAGGRDSCAVTSEQTAECWGQLDSPQGTSLTAVPQPIPRAGVLVTENVAKTVAGEQESCAVTDTGVVACWGAEGKRQLVGFLAGKPVVGVSVGLLHGCAVTSRGQVGCWGSNDFGQLGNASQLDSTDPRAVNVSGVLGQRQVVKVSSGDRHSCALTTDGVIACWGANDAGQLGRSGIEEARTPVAVDTPVDSPAFIDVAAGGAHTCAVTTEGQAMCWGSNSRGQLGDDSVINSDTPVSVDATGALSSVKVAAISAGSLHTCAITSNSRAACWGANTSGQLGDGSTIDSPAPVVVVAPEGSANQPVLSLDAGGAHTLAVVSTASGSGYVPNTPVRAVDTRVTTDTRPAGPLSPGTPLIVDLTDLVPPGATAVTYNVTATQQTAAGYLNVTSTGAAPGASTINWSQARQTIANGYVSKIGSDRALQVTLASAGTTHAIVDVTGFFVPGETPGANAFTGTDRRLFDSRLSGGALPGGSSRTIDIDGEGSAATPQAAAINVTVTGTTGPGFITATALPSAATSTINWSGADQTVANAVITNVNSDGTFTITNYGPTPTHAVVDLTGVFAVPSAGSSLFYPMDPIRSYDSRATGPPMEATQACLVSHPIPVDATAVALNATVTRTEGTGYLSVTPPQTVAGQTSTVNWYLSPTTRANGGIIASSGAATRAYVGGRYCTHFLNDVAGYFR